MLWYTCTPKNFIGNQIFFDRDSGLMSRGLKEIGFGGKAISLGPAKPDDWPDLIRASRTELQNQSWWRGLGIDGVVFYSWGGPTYQLIANAIVDAGLRLVQVSDNHAIYSPLCDWKAHLTAAWSHQWYESTPKKIIRTITKCTWSHTLGILFDDLPLARMIATGDYFASATPASTTRLKRLVRTLLGETAASKIVTAPLPVNAHFRYKSEIDKEDLVVAVGRWDSPQKRVKLLMATISLALRSNENTRFMIFGAPTPALETWHKELSPLHHERVTLAGVVSNTELAAAYQSARVMLVSAAYEGCHNASAEAICCGCSVVAVRSPFMAALDWHASKNSGKLSPSATPPALASTLQAELAEWNRGDRNPEVFGPAWSEVFHPDKVAKRILNLFDNKHGQTG